MIPWLKKTTEQQRHDMVAAARGPQFQRAVARFYDVPLSTVQYWLNRSAGQPLDQVDWSDLPREPHQPHNRTPLELEDLILEVRRELRDESDLGEYGAAAVQTELLRQVPEVPALRTINRVFERRGALNGKRRIRHRPPPRSPRPAFRLTARTSPPSWVSTRRSKAVTTRLAVQIIKLKSRAWFRLAPRASRVL